MRFKMFVFLFLSSIALSVAVYAGEAAKEHGHKSPHGGVVQETDGMHVEFLLDKNGEPKVFLYDKARRRTLQRRADQRIDGLGAGGCEPKDQR